MSAGIDQVATPATDSAGQKADAPDPVARPQVSAGPKRFIAFISYAHTDEAIAARLHKDIETYRLPRQLRAADGAAAHARLGAVFRDRADLAAADSLSEAIRSALADSGALIVLCSPAAVQSRWVNEEIRLFRDLNPGAPVLAAIARGEPQDAMPTALTEGGREPLAADLRDEGDGRKLGFLKIVAALAGVPLDALIQRDAQRKLRRVMAVTVGALLALIATVTMMTYAIQQRNEAQAQRAEAERQRAQANGLVDFMLTDLRERLRGVGRVDIMRAAASKALQNYRQNDSSELPPDSAARLARVLIAVGEDDANRGELDQAELAFREGHQTTAALLESEPNNPERIYDHAQSEFWRGRVHLIRGNVREARQYWQRYHELAVRLNRLEPNSTRSLRELAYGQGNLCTIELAERRPGSTFCHTSYETLVRLARLQPDDQSILLDLANRAAWLADSLQRSGNYERSLEYRDRQLNAARRVYRLDQQNWDHREYLVRALYSVASANFHHGNEARAVRITNEAMTHIRAMRTHDRENERWASLAQLVEALDPR